MNYSPGFFSSVAKWMYSCSLVLLSVNSFAITYSPWPTTTPVVTADGVKQFGGNLSGLFYQPAAGSQPAILWGVRNSPSTLYSLVWHRSSNLFVNTLGNGWNEGKTLHYPDGTGAPDAEGITKAEVSANDIYVSTERDGKGANRFSVLRYLTTGTATSLNATHEWNLTADLPSVAKTNLGLEAITWIPDSYLTAQGFSDEHLAATYNPAHYPLHGTGLFFVGLEANGKIYAYALNSDSSFVRIATIDSGQNTIMDLSFDRDSGVLWAYCDDNCNNRSHLFAIDTTPGSTTRGKFIIRKAYERPASMPNINNEGIAIAPASECINNRKNFFWADDSETDNHSIRRGTISCGALF